jgi:lipopolysaccharide transport system ATP-binding protein
MTRIIEIENLSKIYRLNTQKKGGYSTLVDTLSETAKKWAKRIIHPSQGLQGPSYEEYAALKDVSFHVNEGDRLGVVGRNGAGKSTLLKILSRITEPTSGKVSIRGRVASLLEVGTGFHPELTGRENIFLNGAILGMSQKEIRRNFDEIVAFAEVEKFLDTPVKWYSSGMFTRLGFAISAHLDTDLLIVDEVLAVGDAHFQQKCLKKMNELGSHGRTVLFVSHDVGSILGLCNKGVFLEKGKLKVWGPVEQCITEYLRTQSMHSLKWSGQAGDEHVLFHNVAIVHDDPRKEFFYQGETAKLTVEFEVLKPFQDLVLGFGVWNQRNQLVAGSHTAESHPTGLHRFSFPVNAGLFHEGEYLLKIDCFIPNKKTILKEDIQLKLPIYADKSNKGQPVPKEGQSKEGVFLGHHWTRV